MQDDKVNNSLSYIVKNSKRSLTTKKNLYIYKIMLKEKILGDPRYNVKSKNNM